MIIGIDEVGYGPLAGPLVVMAVTGVEYLPQAVKQQLDDSKNLTASKREYLNHHLLNHEKVFWARSVGSVEDIEQYNILQTAHRGMVSVAEQLLKKISNEDSCFLVDGNKLPSTFLNQASAKKNNHQVTARAVVRGDGLYASIAAAAIMAKVYRDSLMLDYHQQYPAYDFAKHKGYGTARHIESVRAMGPCPIHRLSFLTKILAKGMPNK